MRNASNCGYPEGVVHAHTDQCHRAGIALGRELERAEIVDYLREQAELYVDEPSAAVRRGLLNGVADRLRDHRGPGRPEAGEASAPVEDREPRRLGWLFNKGRGSRG